MSSVDRPTDSRRVLGMTAYQFLIVAMKCGSCSATLRSIQDSKGIYWKLPLAATESDLRKNIPCEYCNGPTEFVIEPYDGPVTCYEDMLA